MSKSHSHSIVIIKNEYLAIFDIVIRFDLPKPMTEFDKLRGYQHLIFVIQIQTRGKARRAYRSLTSKINDDCFRRLNFIIIISLHK
jgi:hypothetical protein